MSRPPDGAHVPDDVLVDLAAELVTGERGAETLAHLRVCPDCERRFREACTGAMRAGLRPQPRLEDGRIVLEAPESDRPRASRGRRRVAWLAAAAAVALIAFGVSRWEGSGGGDRLDYWLPIDPDDVLLRVASPEADRSRLREAVEAYIRHDARRVVELLEDREIPGAYEHLKLILASALVHEGRLPQALAVLERLDVATLPQPARDRALRIRYVALRRAHDDAAADAVLAQLARGAGESAEWARGELRRR